MIFLYVKKRNRTLQEPFWKACNNGTAGTPAKQDREEIKYYFCPFSRLFLLGRFFYQGLSDYIPLNLICPFINL